MAKPIYISDFDIDDICAELKRTLSGTKCYGAIDVKRSFKSDERIAVLQFTPAAWMKMNALVSRFKTEVQWHGMVRRVSENEFSIYDVIVPPHEVSGATVTSEYRPYLEWMNGLSDDTFNAMRFHGHSHVSMAVSPSTTDMKYRSDLITQLPKPSEGEDMFYIFFIINKHGEWSAEIYDLTNNALYGTNDIYIECLVDGVDIDSFVADARKVAVERTVQTYNNTKHYGQQNTPRAGSVNVPRTSTVNVPTTPPKSSAKHAPDKRKKGVRTGGPCCGYDTWEDYYYAVYGDDFDPTDPFSARGY